MSAECEVGQGKEKKSPPEEVTPSAFHTMLLPKVLWKRGGEGCLIAKVVPDNNELVLNNDEQMPNNDGLVPNNKMAGA